MPQRHQAVYARFLHVFEAINLKVKSSFLLCPPTSAHTTEKVAKNFCTRTINLCCAPLSLVSPLHLSCGALLNRSLLTFTGMTCKAFFKGHNFKCTHQGMQSDSLYSPHSMSCACCLLASTLLCCLLCFFARNQLS